MKKLIICLKVGFLCILGTINIQGQQFSVKEQIYENIGGSLQIIQDQKGNIWSWSQNTIYRITPYGTEQIGASGQYPYYSGNRSLKFFEDKNGLIWILYADQSVRAGINGYEIRALDILNPLTKLILPFSTHFQKKLPFQLSELFHIYPDATGVLWIGTKQGQLYTYDGDFSFLFSLEGDQSVGFATAASPQSFWLATKNGFMEVGQTGNVLQQFQLEGQPQDFMVNQDASLWVWTFDQQSLSHLYVKSANEGLKEFILPDSIKSKNVIIHFSGTDQIWLVGHSFLSLWQPESNTIITDLSKPIYSKIHGPHNVFQFYVDHQGQTWLNANNWELMIKNKPSSFTNFLTDQRISLRGITSFNDSSLWINSYSGVFTLNRNSNEISRAAIDDLSEGLDQRKRILPKENIYGMGVICDSNNNIWSAVEGNFLFNYDINNQQTTTWYLPDSRVRRDTKIPFIDQNNTLWAGLSNGLVYFDDQKDQFVEFDNYNQFTDFPACYVQDIFENQEGLWIASDQGVYLLKHDRGLTAHYKGFPSNNVVHIHEDVDGIFWLSTRGGGLIRWDRHTENILQISMGKEQRENHVHAAYEDDYGYLWLPTNHGLKKLNKQTLEVQTYLVEDGLPSNEFNFLSHYQAFDGRFYFGGVNGLTSFHPKDFLNEPINRSHLLLESFRELDETGKWHEKNLSQRDTTVGFTLSAEIRAFDLSFMLMEYGTAKALYYAYQLEGYDENWQYTEENRLQYNRLPFGAYILKIKGQGNHGKWSNNELVIPIEVLKPYYLQTWFILCVGLIGVLLVYGLLAWRITRLKNTKMNLERKVDQRTKELQELNQMKDQLFRIIGHDLRGPIIGLSGLGRKIEYLLQHDQKERLAKVGQQAEHQIQNLHILIDNLLAWSISQNSTVNQIKKPTLAFADIIHEQIDLLQPQILQKHQKIIYVEKEKLQFQNQKLILGVIVRNLLANSIRYGGKASSILLTVESFQHYPSLIIQDEGPGMSSDLIRVLNQCNEMNIPQQAGSQEGLGLGLWICSRLLQHVHGKWYFENHNSGQGLKVRLWFEVPLIGNPSRNL